MSLAGFWLFSNGILQAAAYSFSTVYMKREFWHSDLSSVSATSKLGSCMATWIEMPNEVLLSASLPLERRLLMSALILPASKRKTSSFSRHVPQSNLLRDWGALAASAALNRKSLITLWCSFPIMFITL